MRPQVQKEATVLQRKGVRWSGSGSKSVGNSPRGKKISREKSGKKGREIFRHEQRSNKEISKDIIRADCMNHGYRLEKSIGEGAYAKVKSAEVLPSKLARNETLAELAEETETYLQVAIKVIENKHVPKEFLKKFLPRELSNHCPLEPHKNVVRVFEQFRTTERVYVVMEYCSKGDLLDLINQRTSESHRGIGEDRARDMFKQMIDGVQHIHNSGIVHRDLKCENILIGANYSIKLTDFGFSTRYDDKECLLRTSCGSYAYTAPEVIKSRPYNGFKSDTWSLGIILFAMLNGRLPFNDSQLMEMEEDMKMQRLRFERNVSFDAMVLVRRILQYNPSQRPSLQEILNDPWMTGKKMIPRQINRTKWINPYEAKPGEMDITDEEVVGSNPVYYKATVPDRGHDATVTVKHEGNETVMLKSRRIPPKKNAWASGPNVVCQNRPGTWPKSVKESEQTKRNHPRAYARNGSANTTVIVKSPEPKNRTTRTHTTNTTARVSNNAVQMSKWFMDKFMKKKEDKVTNKMNPSDCNYCKSDASLKETYAANQNTRRTPATQNPQSTNTTPKSATLQKTSPENQTNQKPLEQASQKAVPQNKTATVLQNQAANMASSQKQAVPRSALQRPKQTNTTNIAKIEEKDQPQEHDPDPDRLLIDFGLLEDEMKEIDIEDPPPSPDIDVSIWRRGPSRGSLGSGMSRGSSKGKGSTSSLGSRMGQEKLRTQSCNSGRISRKPFTMSASANGKSGPRSSSPTASKSVDLSHRSLYKYMVNRSTNPTERVKYFREKFMMLYGTSIQAHDERENLPPLICQGIRAGTPNKSDSLVRPSSRIKTDNVRAKPIQRVVVHSAS